MPQYQGIWSLQQQAQAQSNQQWVEDPYFKNTVLLLQADNVANGSNNNLFIDSSSNAFAITRNGNATQGSFTPYGPGWSSFVNGSGNYIETTTNSPLATNATTFTIETWLYMTAVPTTTAYMGMMSASQATGANGAWFFGPNSTRYLIWNWYDGSNVLSTTSTTTLMELNKWYHVAISVNANAITMYVNGVPQTLTGTTTLSNRSGNYPLTFGQWATNSSYFFGNISNTRIISGQSLFSGTFIPATTPLGFSTVGATGAGAASSISGSVIFLGNQSNEFLDNSTSGLLFNRYGTSSVQSFSPFTSSFAPIATTYSKSFDGANAYANVSTSAANANLILSTSDFTIESWIYPRVLGSERAILSKWSNTTGGRSFVFELNSSNQPTFLYSTDGTGTVTLTGTTAVSGNAWTHVAISRSANTANIYVNGILSGSNASFSPNIFAANVANVNIGRYMNAAANIAVWNGFITNTRVVKGTAVYTANFTPSQAPLTAIANTSLLVCQSNTIVDAGPSNFTIATQGNVGVSSSVIPFNASYQENPTYQTSTIGGSGYFDRSGDYLDVASSSNLTIGTSDFTIALWAYFNTIDATSQIIFEGRPSTVADNVTPLILWSSVTSSLSYVVNSTSVITAPTTSIKSGNWHHIAVSRVSSITRMFVNGIQVGNNYADTNSYVAFATDRPRIGNRGNSSGAGLPFGGYMSDVQMLRGRGLYTSNFAPPLAPSTPVANTQLLLNFTNASIYDATMKNNLETVGDVQISTFPYENGSGSIKFDGTGDYIIAANTQLTAFGNVDFTVETWLYPTSLPGTAQYIFDARATTTGAAIQFYINTTKTLGVAVGTTVVATTGNILELNKWSHVALVKNNGRWMIYINGKASVTSASLTNTTSLTQTGVVTIGASTNNRTTTTTDKFTGYMDDFRVTNGVARYTSNFIPPKQALPRQ